MENVKFLIDVNAVTDTIEDITWYHVNENGDLVEGSNPEYNTPLYKAEDIYKALASAPVVDAVEVVRCKDCKHYMTIHCTCDGCCISDDWYCADGERRTDHGQG